MTDTDGGEQTSSQASGGVTATLFTQDQVNHFSADAKRGAVSAFFKEAGLTKPLSAEEVKAVMAKAAEFEKREQGEKTDVERLTTQLAEVTQKAELVPGFETELNRARIAADAGLKSRYWKYIEGETDTDIAASVAAVLADVGGASNEDGDDDGETPPQGGRPPNPQQGRGGGGPGKATMQSGRDTYKSKYQKE